MDSVPELVTLSGGPAIAIRAQLPLRELPSFFATAFGELAGAAADQMAGPPFARYHAVDATQVDVEAVVPLRTAVPPSGRVRPLEIVGGPAVQIRHVGPYEELHGTYATLERYLAEHGRERSGPVHEVYLTPPNVPPAEHVTLVVQPVAAA